MPACASIIKADGFRRGLIGSPISGELVPHGYLALSAYVASTLMLGGIILTVVRCILSRKLVAKV